MGGKNPVIVTAAADIDEATDGVMRSAFGFGGQKCSAASRVYVERPVVDEFIDGLVARAEKVAVGDPLEPVGVPRPGDRPPSRRALQRSGGRSPVSGSILCWRRSDLRWRPRPGELRPTDCGHRPRFVVDLEAGTIRSLVAVAAVDDIDEGLARANDTEYGLTAGFYSHDQAEIDRFLTGIEAGVVYINRRAGATTGAWPGVQPFGGWKGSGTSGKAGGGPHYLTQYLGSSPAPSSGGEGCSFLAEGPEVSEHLLGVGGVVGDQIGAPHRPSGVD